MHGEIDPALHVRDFPIEERSGRMREGVADGVVHAQTEQERLPAQRAAILGGRRVGKVIRRRFDRVEVHLRRRVSTKSASVIDFFGPVSASRNE